MVTDYRPILDIGGLKLWGPGSIRIDDPTRPWAGRWASSNQSYPAAEDAAVRAHGILLELKKYFVFLGQFIESFGTVEAF
jgi:hypothetical protein